MLIRAPKHYPCIVVLNVFFQHVHLDDASVAGLIVHIMGLAGKPWHLALGKFGRCHINILMLGVVHEKV